MESGAIIEGKQCVVRKVWMSIEWERWKEHITVFEIGLYFLRTQMRDFQDLLKIRTSYLFILLLFAFVYKINPLYLIASLAQDK